jgi:nanoRNase/pAp phosphatase (c-di-AMP/oligoRNAs hydrolase)
MQNDQLQEIVSTLNNANNVLVTVKNSPSVDELSAAIGLTLALNKADKHATTVFSGEIPSALEFLQPESVIENNTDSLRDFIIALDKSKADKLRYKVEDNVVRIFITPYKTSITDADLDFSQGDFNVDAVIALGVVTKEDFDTAITAHGRILHDATIVAVTKQNVVSQVGGLNWQEPRASSVSEMIAAVVDAMNPDILDGQMATAFLTGIVAETERFKNEKTTPDDQPYFTRDSSYRASCWQLVSGGTCLQSFQH